jgi:GNAT superfamily N-acetyltransferase
MSHVAAAGHRATLGYPMTAIEPATPAQAYRIARVIADAFHGLEVGAWLVPDPRERARVFPAYFEILVEHAIAHGTVHVTAELTAAAVWLPYTPGGGPEIDDYDGRVLRVCQPYAARFHLLETALAVAHPSGPGHEADPEPECDHLLLLGVAPDRQRRGLGSALLAYHHKGLDRRGVPAYLEASSARSRDLYLRHGYRPHGNPITVPGAPDPTMWPLWRAPGSGS